jgi:hypothetical protein
VVALAVFAVFLIATLCIHVIGYMLRPRPRTVGSKILLYLGLLIVVCIGWQHYNTKQDAIKLQVSLDERLPRTIKDEQRQLIVGLLKPSQIYKGPVFMNYPLDAEAWAFSNQIKDVLKDAGFDPADLAFGDRALALSKPGQFIWLKDNDNQPRHAGPIYEAFKRAGIIFTGEEHKEAGSGIPDAAAVVIVISSHP